ncbi:helix-turn-helix domain-containing protein [Phytoactinopolyspora endophytica]|uniref:helix-turn-helix domain-containing protein n=1 Tax=Phytoactinopolyspora endophytica TaxID=1642495 RepID=UPI00101B777C|nr:helix-turn-helix domain-containing protein [Phytoactinopolyspora endophytica]
MAKQDDPAGPDEHDVPASGNSGGGSEHEVNESQEEPEPLSVAPRYLHKVLDLIEAHPEYDHTTGSMAIYASISERALQYRFKRHLQTTPKTHLRNVRMERVRTDLLAASPGDTTADNIAHRWGFRHYGHFTAMYTQRFNEKPAQALYRPPSTDGAKKIPEPRQGTADDQPPEAAAGGASGKRANTKKGGGKRRRKEE